MSGPVTGALASAPPLFAGLDGGASKTRVRVTDRAGAVVGEGASGPGSLTIGVETAALSVRSALAQALAGVGVGKCLLVCGLAGSRQAERRRRFEDLLADVGQLEVISDGFAALLGAHQGAAGAIVIVGTGSVGLRLDDDQRCHQVGGWGPVVGDEGGGSWLGREAVRAALRAIEDGSSDTPFLAALREILGGTHERILSWVANATATEFAGLAPLLLDHAGTGDPAARRLLEAAAIEVTRLVRLTSRSGRVPIALLGGLAAAIGPRLDDEVGAWLVPAAADPMAGALLRARGLAPPEVYAP
jgi:glucosamine kinase